MLSRCWMMSGETEQSTGTTTEGLVQRKEHRAGRRRLRFHSQGGFVASAVPGRLPACRGPAVGRAPCQRILRGTGADPGSNPSYATNQLCHLGQELNPWLWLPNYKTETALFTGFL